VVAWTEAVLQRAHVYFALMELDLRSAQNVLRFIRALKAESLPHEKLRYILNRAPRFADLGAKSRVKRMAESLDIAIEVQLPDGGAQVTQANDHGLPLSESAAKNPLRKEIQKLAKSLFELNRAVETARK
jgi:pilus assembly protein CpaE